MDDWNEDQDDDSIAWSDDPSVSDSDGFSLSSSDDANPDAPPSSPPGPLHLLPYSAPPLTFHSSYRPEPPSKTTESNLTRSLTLTLLQLRNPHFAHHNGKWRPLQGRFSREVSVPLLPCAVNVVRC